MNTNWRMVSTIVALLAVIAGGDVWAGGPPVLSVHGHGAWYQQSGLPDGGNFTNQVSINAWLNEDGTADGVLEWTWQNHSVPGDGGQLNSGYPWTVFVDTLIHIDEHSVFISGLVVNSGQNPDDVGSSASFLVTDNGNGGDDPPDELTGIPIDAGNFTIQQ